MAHNQRTVNAHLTQEGHMKKRDTMQRRVNCLMTQPQYEAANDAAEKAGLSLAAFIRQAVIAAVKEATK